MDSAQKFLVRDAQGNVFGPADAGMLRVWVVEGRIIAGMAIAAQETREWIEASTHPAVADLLAGRAGEAAPLPVSAAAPMATGVAITREGPVHVQSPAGYPAAAIPPGGHVLAHGPPAASNPLGVTSFLLGLVASCTVCFSLACCLMAPMSGLLSVAAITMGSIALWQMKQNPAHYRGRGLAIAGVVMGTAVLVLMIVSVIVMGVIAAMSGP